MAYLSNLQVIRGIAILLVLAFHCTQGKMDTGTFGVNLFFALSGFVIFYAHSKDRGWKDAKTFAAKRVLRVYPVYLPVLFIFLILFYSAGSGDDWHRDPLVILKNALLIHPKTQSLHPYSWTLVYEMYYYFTFGFLCILLGMRLPVYSVYTIAGLVVGHFLERDVGIWGSTQNLYFLTGVLLSAVYLRYDWLNSFLLGVVLLFSLTISANAFYLLVTTITLFVFCIYWKWGWVRWIERIGAASYSIYLIHALIVPSFRRMGLLDGYAHMFIAFIVSGLTGYLYYCFYERNVIRFFKR